MKSILEKITGRRVIGRNNRIVFIYADGSEQPVHWHHKIRGLRIFISGNNNVIKLNSKCQYKNSAIRIRGCDSCTVEILGDKFVGAKVLLCDDPGQRLVFGRHSSVSGMEAYIGEKAAGLIIGEYCRLSDHIRFWCCDAHSVVDKETGAVLNHVGGPVIIGDRCWICQSARLQKNSSLAPFTIVGAGAVVAKSFSEPFCVIAGNPAKVIKSGVVRMDENPASINEEFIKGHIAEIIASRATNVGDFLALASVKITTRARDFPS